MPARLVKQQQSVFFPAKVLGCLGDGGVITNGYAIFDKVYQLHDHDRDVHSEVKSWGRNSSRDKFQNAILNHRIKSYDKVIERGRSMALIYQDRLGAFEELQLPPGPNQDSNHFDICQNYELQADRRDALREHLRINGVGTLIQWGGKSVHQWERLSVNVNLPKVERFFERCIMLPMNIFIGDDDVHCVCDQIKVFYRG